MESQARQQDLSQAELDALAAAAAWYAKYHARIIAERADDPSAQALAQRERYLALLSGLEKLGFRIRNPLPRQTADTGLEREAA